MPKRFVFLFIFLNIIFSQTDNDKMVVQENSVYWKTGVDKLVLKDGELFYGEYLGNQDKKITFKIEFKDKANIFEVSNIRHLELANGKNIIRNNRDHSMGCSFIWFFISIYFYQFHNQVG